MAGEFKFFFTCSGWMHHYNLSHFEDCIIIELEEKSSRLRFLTLLLSCMTVIGVSLIIWKHSYLFLMGWRKFEGLCFFLARICQLKMVLFLLNTSDVVNFWLESCSLSGCKCWPTQTKHSLHSKHSRRRVKTIDKAGGGGATEGMLPHKSYDSEKRPQFNFMDEFIYWLTTCHWALQLHFSENSRTAPHSNWFKVKIP